jgi:hypothetical protein
MPVGTCKLCQTTARLQKSHLLPAAAYRYVRDLSKKNENPVVVGKKVTATSSRQVQDYLLCAACEDLFNKNGERWFLKQVWNGQRFPLGDKLRLALPVWSFPEWTVFSGRDVGIDTDQLSYFALSVVWRAAVHQWTMPFGDKSTVLYLGAAEQPIRDFLLGNVGFPPDVMVWSLVCTDTASIRTFLLPTAITTLPFPAFHLNVLGITCFVFTRVPAQADIRELCCRQSTRRVICQRDCEDKTLDAFATLFATTKRAKNMQDL